MIKTLQIILVLSCVIPNLYAIGSSANACDTLTTIAHPDSLSLHSDTPNHRKERAKELVKSMFIDEDSRFNRADSVLKAFDSAPPFGIYKDNYIVSGTTLQRTPTADNSDAKFQVSISHRLTSSMLPFKTYLYLTYTQVAIWDIFKDSFPFRDINYNPTLGLGKALVSDNRYLGNLILQFEHESNGKDGEASRSWNKVSLVSNIIFNRYWSIAGKIWIPFVDGENNRDLSKYVGWSNWAVEYRDKRAKYIINATVAPRPTSKIFSSNLQLSFSIKLNKMANQYLFINFYNGYGENLLDYKEYRRQLRVGVVIKTHQGLLL